MALGREVISVNRLSIAFEAPMWAACRLVNPYIVVKVMLWLTTASSETDNNPHCVPMRNSSATGTGWRLASRFSRMPSATSRPTAPPNAPAQNGACQPFHCASSPPRVMAAICPMLVKKLMTPIALAASSGR
ncbi:hypothetical protein GCM10010885_13310 [Alicyclobacillus cellulosilyticus]|uniref:Uncharacterized protein n=1 Tax=Alicyclobacillus cellulosilyticus TaxID=1003997 RepID=A0A917NJP4_9BACL|nr:hypothetical protein GCM10010885_13310 [Alicyclobacillus cellulosilyticus]